MTCASGVTELFCTVILKTALQLSVSDTSTSLR